MPKRAISTKPQPCIRWIVLIIVSIASFSYYYSYDIPLALQTQFVEYYNLNGIKYTLLYSIYAYPFCILSFLNGIFADIIGFNTILLISFSIIVVGQFLIYCSFLITNIDYGYLILLLGRLMYGIGSESFLVLITPMIYSYFKYNELSLSLGLYFTISRLGSAITLILSYYYYINDDGIHHSVSIGLYILCGCLLCLIGLIIYRIQQKQYLLRAHTIGSTTSQDVWNPADNNHNNHNITNLENDINLKMQLLRDDHKQSSYNTNNSDGDESKISTVFSSIMPTTYIQSDIIIICTNRENKFRFSDIMQFNIRYWLLILNCCLISGAILPFITIGSSYLQNMYKYSHFDANLLLMIPIIICAVFTPICNIFIEKYGGRCQCLLLSSIFLSISHYIIGNIDIGINTSYYPIIALFGIGIAYCSFTAVIWPSFALVVEPNLLPTAYCIQTSIYHAIIATLYLIVGILMVDNDTHDINQLQYENVNWFLLLLSLFSIITVALLWYFDEKHIENQKDTPNMKQNDNASTLLMSGYTD